MRKTRTRSNKNAKTRRNQIQTAGSEKKIKTLTIEKERDICILESTLISSDPNTDPSYRHVGLIHFTDAAGINIVRGVFTNVANVFGKKGFDNTIYDELRKTTLEKVQKLLKPGQKICSCRMDFDVTPTNGMIFHHFYGTLYEKGSSSSPPSDDETSLSVQEENSHKSHMSHHP